MFENRKHLSLELAPRKVSVGTFRPTEQTYANVKQVLDTGILSYGPFSRQLEHDFSELHECRYGVLSNSGTSSLEVAVQAMKELYGWQDGDEVIVPATTFAATANVVLHNRLTPVFVDCDWTYNINPDLIERAVTKRTRAIIPVHMFGRPASMGAVKFFAERHNLRIIEDSCEAAFVSTPVLTEVGGGYAEVCWRRVGSVGDVGCFSFYVAHLLVAGVGGIGITNDPDLAAKMRSLVNHGLDIAQLNPDENFAPRPAVGRRFVFTSSGHSYRLTELEAAVALPQLSEWTEMIRMRHRNARHLIAGLTILNHHAGEPFILPQPPHVESRQTMENAFMMLPVVLREGMEFTKEELTAFLNENLVETRDMPSLLGHPCFGLDPDQYPVSKAVYERGFYLGTHGGISPKDCDYTAFVFDKFIHRKSYD